MFYYAYHHAELAFAEQDEEVRGGGVRGVPPLEPARRGPLRRPRPPQLGTEPLRPQAALRTFQGGIVLGRLLRIFEIGKELIHLL